MPSLSFSLIIHYYIFSLTKTITLHALFLPMCGIILFISSFLSVHIIHEYCIVPLLKFLKWHYNSYHVIFIVHTHLVINDLLITGNHL